MKKIVLSALFIFIAIYCNAQRVRVTGLLIDADSSNIKYDALVNVVGSSEAFFTDIKGKFVLYVNKRDSIKLFVQGYKTFKLCLADSVLKKEYFINVILQKISTIVKPVHIRGPKTLQQIETDITKIYEIPHELKTMEIGATNVISMLYEQFSKSGRNRTMLREKTFEQNRRVVLNELYRFYNYHDVIHLPERYFENFTDYHQLPIEFLQSNTYYDISVTIKAYYKKYAALKLLE